jgi:hypothetical protein
VATAATMTLATRWAWGPAASPRCWLAALALVGLGIAPIVPTTYWLGRASGTYGARILAAALPGAALLVLLGIARLLPGPRGRALGFAVVLSVAFAFHWNVGRLAAENWSVQHSLAKALVAASFPPRGASSHSGPAPNRLSYDTPWRRPADPGDLRRRDVGIDRTTRAPRDPVDGEGDFLVKWFTPGRAGRGSGAALGGGVPSWP